MKTQTDLETRQTDRGPGAPRYAIVRLSPKDDVFNLFRLLVRSGYHEVSFVNGLKHTVLPWPLAGAMKEESSSSQQNGHESVDSSDTSLKIDGSPPSDSNSDSEAGHAQSAQSSIRQNESSTSLNSHCSVVPEIPSPKSTAASIPMQLFISPSGNSGFPHYSSSGMLPHVSVPPPITSLVPDFSPPSLGMPSFLNRGSSGVPMPASISREVVTPPYSMPNQPVVPTTSCGIPFFQKFPNLQPPPLQVAVSGPLPTTTSIPLTPMTLHSPSVIPLTTPATTQLRQRGSRAQSDDPSVYVACRLCNNKIMASRLSNLTNHVRRHSTLKQFQCCYCDYTHNEMAKVRLHMLHNHKDKDSQPIDNLSPEMQTSWDLLMQQCFPDHYQGGQGANQSIRCSRNLCSDTKPTELPLKSECEKTPSKSDLCGPEIPLRNSPGVLREISSQTRPCFECGEIVIPVDRLEHIRQNHMECYPYVCSLCGYDHPDQGKVLLHINLKHGDSTTAQVFTRDIGIVAEALIPKYFPESQTPMEITPVQTPIESRKLSEQNGVADPSDTGQSTHDPTPMPSQESMCQNHLDSQMDLRAFQMVSEHQSERTAENLRCQLCRKVLDGIRPLSSLLNHAKRHYHIKQFQCTECPYSSSEAAHVRSHMKLKHHLRGKTPLDNRSTPLQQAWMQTMARCFPSVAPRLKRFRFKNFRSKPSGRPKTSGSSDRACLKIVENGSFSGSPSSVQNSGNTTENCDESHCASGSDNNTKSVSPSLENHRFEVNTETFQSSDLPLNKEQCRLCDRWVTTEDLFPHATTHITLKPFGCSVCPFRTSDYQHLRAHLWKHKLIGGERHKARIAANNSEINSIRAEYVSYCFGAD